MDVRITELEPQDLVCLRSVGDYWCLPTIWKRLFELLVQHHAPLPPRLGMTVFHDHHAGIPQARKRADVGLALLGPCELVDGLFSYTTPGGLYAITPHFGPGEEIGPFWEEWRTTWLPTSGWQLDTTRPSLEWYQSNPEVTPPELQVTLLCDPVLRA